MAKRIYVVAPVPPAALPEGYKPPLPRLVRASTKSVAVAHVAKQEYTANVADQEELVSLVGKKVKVEEAGDA